MPERRAVLIPHGDELVIESGEDQETRLREAVKQARKLSRQLKSGDREALAEAVMLQGILAGDVTSAAIATKLRLQNEMLRIKQRMHRQRLQLEALKTRILAKSLEQPQPPSWDDVLQTIEEVYGLRRGTVELRSLPEKSEEPCTQNQSASQARESEATKSPSNSEMHLTTLP